MKPALSKIILLAGLALFFAQAHADIAHPLGNDCFRFSYDQIYRAGVLSGEVSSIPPVGPYFDKTGNELSDRDDVASFQLFDIVRTDNESPLRLFNISSESFRAARSYSPDELPSLVGGFAYLPGNNFGVVTFFNLDRAKAIDPDYTGKKYRGLAGDIETAALYFNKDRVSLTLGRTRLFWGPQRVNLLISETADPLDLLSASYQTGRIGFNFVFARLDNSHPDEIDSLRFPDRSFNDNRYLVGHRLDLKLHRTFRLGFFETVLFGGEGRPPELYYLNPLQFFHGAQLNEGKDDNTILGFDFSFMPGKGSNIYGQMIVDDFQVDDASQDDQEPNEIGIMLGMFKAGRVASLIPDIKVEYVRLTNRTYHQRDPSNRYLYRNNLIGHPLGPDADSVSFTARFWPDRSFSAELEFAYRRKGEGSIHQPWDEPWLLAAGEYSEPFPTGVVEKSTLVSVKLNGYLPFSKYTRDHFFLSMAAGWGEIRNHLNIEDDTRTVARIDGRISWLGFTDIDID